MIKKQINIDISEIKPYNKNNKKHGNNINEIVKSIQANGYITPILLDEDNVILAGHGRYEAIKRLEMKKIDVIQVAGLSDKQKRDFRIRDNKLAELSEWDFENLKFELDDLNIPDLSDLFKDEEEMQGEEQTAEEDDYVVPDEITTDIVIGDLFEIGEHRLLCGDSTDSDQVAKLMNGEKADLGLTDPPYNLGYDYATYDDNLTSEEYNDFIIGYVSNLISFSEKQIITSGKQNVGYYYKNFDITEFAVWYAKNKMSGSKIANLGLCEPILFIGKFNRNARATDMFEFTVKQQKETGGHTCPKVMEFFSDLLNSYSDRLILDLFLGSGTTMVASHQLKRKCYGMELDTKYCQVIIDRMYKLDPSLTFKKNGQPYNPETKDLILFDK